MQTMRFKSSGLIIYLSLLAAITPFSTDIYLASMPTIAREFHSSSLLLQLTLSLFFSALRLANSFGAHSRIKSAESPQQSLALVFILSPLYSVHFQ